MKYAIDLVVFDIAGTTVKDNGEITRSFQKAMREAGYEIPAEKVNALMGYKKTEAIRLMLQEYEENWDKISTRLINKIHQRFLDEMIDYYRSTKMLQPLPNAENVFDELRNNKIKVALNTGFSKEITDVIMERLEWIKNKKVDYVISSSEVAEGRPFPFMIEELMNRANVQDPRRVVKVGDTESDVHEGKNAGCLYSIAVTTGAFTRKALEEHQPSFIIDDLRELFPILESKAVYA